VRWFAVNLHVVEACIKGILGGLAIIVDDAGDALPKVVMESAF
jgi:hypothetical protein